MKHYYLYAAGSFIQTKDILKVKEKYTDEYFAEVCMADEKILEECIQKAVGVENEMSELSSGAKYKILKQISDAIFENRKTLAEIIAMEAGKPLKYALIEAERASQTFLIAAEEAKRIYSEILSLDWFSDLRKEAVVKLFPVGTVAGITPFNFPLNLVAHKLAPAIAAGCPIILKPASATPVSSLELAAIINKTDLPKSAFSVLPMSHIVSKPLIEDERIKKISFTGSPEVGWEMKTRCRKKRITLELGGNAAAVVTPSADFEEAVAKCVTGAFAYSGQVCIHTQRIFVHESIYDNFVRKFVERTSKLKYGNPLETDTDISVMIDETNAIRVENWINEAVISGAKVLIGGKRTGSYLDPTVLTNTHKDMKVRKEEIFGPVVCIEKYLNFDEAIDLVNDSRFGLQSGVFTNNIQEMNIAFTKIKAGGIMINESPTFRMDHMPYGGLKESGFGKEGVKYAIFEMSDMKILVKTY
jgi:glyceraldehyde-3-phosphate dehydrogenase (NADP+)